MLLDVVIIFQQRSDRWLQSSYVCPATNTICCLSISGMGPEPVGAPIMAQNRTVTDEAHFS